MSNQVKNPQPGDVLLHKNGECCEVIEVGGTVLAVFCFDGCKDGRRRMTGEKVAYRFPWRARWERWARGAKVVRGAR